MPISEAARSDLYTGLSEVLGPNRTETLRSAIPLLHSLSEAVQKLDRKLDRLIFILIAGLFAVIATLIGVGLVV